MKLPFLIPFYTIYAINLRGHVGSGQASAYGCSDYVGDVANFLQESFKDPVSICGHSLGALVAMKFAAENVSLCRSVVLIDPPLEPDVMDDPGAQMLYMGSGAYPRLPLPGFAYVPERVRIYADLVFYPATDSRHRWMPSMGSTMRYWAIGVPRCIGCFWPRAVWSESYL